MRAVFADTCYWIALLNPRDQTHDIAVRVSKGLTDYTLSYPHEYLSSIRDLATRLSLKRH
jgi:predicted nucleic acid-binding protein